jgi:hypothetical protein
MIFTVSMDHTVFLLSSAEEHWDRTHDAREAMIGGVAHSGRVIFAAAAPDGRGVLRLRALRAAAAKGDGHHPRASPSCSMRFSSACCCCCCRCCCG